MNITFQPDLKNSITKRVITKYVIILFISLLAIVLIGQLISLLFTVNQFHKVTGKIIANEIKVTGYTYQGRLKKGIPSNSLVLTLDNKQSYNIDLADNIDWTINDLLHKGDRVTIYEPSNIYLILSLDGLDFGSRVSQVENNHQVLYSFKVHQRKAYKFILFLIAGILVFCYFLYDWYKTQPRSTVYP